MKNKVFTALRYAALGVLIMAKITYAHGTEKHDKGMQEDAQMKKLHAMMPIFSVSLAQMEAALEKGDRDVVVAEGDKILAAIPDLKKSKPHKNIKERKKFVDMASSLDLSVKSTIGHAQNNDFSSAKSALKKVEVACATCHAKFRD